MGSPRTEEPALAVTISRQGDDLAWQVQNVGKQDVWAFLLVPSVVDGRRSFAVETAWLEEEGEGTLVVRKVDTPVPPGVLVDDAIRSGAILMKPGESKQGRLKLGKEVALRIPYRGGAGGKIVKVQRVIMEVGWVPFRAEAKPRLLQWEGQPFAYLFTPDEPGGQRFARSAPLDWAR